LGILFVAPLHDERGSPKQLLKGAKLLATAAGVAFGVGGFSRPQLYSTIPCAFSSTPAHAAPLHTPDSNPYDAFRSASPRKCSKTVISEGGTNPVPVSLQIRDITRRCIGTRRISMVKSKTQQKHKWSGEVTENSDALDLEKDVFKNDDPDEIARSLKRSAEQSSRRKSAPFRSAMSMLTFYIRKPAGSAAEDAGSGETGSEAHFRPGGEMISAIAHTA
jgi:hypothetical protein